MKLLNKLDLKDVSAPLFSVGVQSTVTKHRSLLGQRTSIDRVNTLKTEYLCYGESRQEKRYCEALPESLSYKCPSTVVVWISTSKCGEEKPGRRGKPDSSMYN